MKPDEKIKIIANINPLIRKNTRGVFHQYVHDGRGSEVIIEDYPGYGKTLRSKGNYIRISTELVRPLGLIDLLYDRLMTLLK